MLRWLVQCSIVFADLRGRLPLSGRSIEVWYRSSEWLCRMVHGCVLRLGHWVCLLSLESMRDVWWRWLPLSWRSTGVLDWVRGLQQRLLRQWRRIMLWSWWKHGVLLCKGTLESVFAYSHRILNSTHPTLYEPQIADGGCPCPDGQEKCGAGKFGWVLWWE
jgi:hypothetical protein